MKNFFTRTIEIKCPILVVQIIALGALLVISLAGNVRYLYMKHDAASCNNKYSFVNKRFACFEAHTIDKREYNDLKERLTAYISEEKEKGNVGTVSLFFRDLESGPTMGIDERVDYIPASLLKLPNVLILMRLHEEGEIDIATEKMVYTKEEEAADKNVRTQYDIVPGEYTLESLITHSLQYSDNAANRLLLKYIASIDRGRNLSFEIYRDLGILEVTDTVSSAVNTKGYSTIFRMLYNSSFLRPDSSEKLLSIMANAVSVGGLRDGVPNDISVAHKFGERSTDATNRQLHDCGIVYYPGNPYLLCVMTKGRDLAKLREVISHISKAVYEEVDARKITI